MGSPCVSDPKVMFRNCPRSQYLPYRKIKDYESNYILCNKFESLTGSFNQSCKCMSSTMVESGQQELARAKIIWQKLLGLRYFHYRCSSSLCLAFCE